MAHVLQSQGNALKKCLEGHFDSLSVPFPIFIFIFTELSQVCID
jgi:hypothetical protein